MRQTRLSSLQTRCPCPQAQEKPLPTARKPARTALPTGHLQPAEAQSRRLVKVRAAPPTLEEPAQTSTERSADAASDLPDRQQQPGAGPSANGAENNRGFKQRSRGRQETPQATPVEVPPCAVGDTVTATVVWSGERGMRAALASDNTIRGFVPISHTPYRLRDQMGRNNRPNQQHMPIGVTRDFLVMSVPDEGMEHYGRGPLLSAKELDRDMCWQRCTQVMEICTQEQEYINVTIESANRGGCVASFEGVIVFIPFSRIPRNSSTILTQEDLEAKWVGKTVPCVIEQVEPHNNKIIGNIRAATGLRSGRQLQVGNVVWGTVVRMMDFGAFIKPEEAEVDCLLHVSCISRSHVNNPADVLSIGERIRCLVTGVREGGRRISLSTGNLEVNEGDMLHNKEGVYATAEQMGQSWMENRSQQQGQRDQRGNDGGYRDDGGQARRGGYGNRQKRDSFDDFGFDGGRSGGGDNFDDIWN